MHRIIDERMSAAPQRNLHMFEKLTGSRSAKNVVLATTMWDKLYGDDDGDKREMGLKEEYWNAMIDQGATVERFLNTSESAWSIVNNMVKKNVPKAALLFQEERVDQKKYFEKTGAGEALDLHHDNLIERQENTIQGPVGWSDSNGSGSHSPIGSP